MQGAGRHDGRSSSRRRAAASPIRSRSVSRNWPSPIPTANIGEFARGIGVEQRRLERIVKRDFGLPPKQVLRRARVLDMASHLRGVADGEEADELELRFYDQSHMIHDFVEYFGMTPGQFVEIPQPILTLALESRQARRLEAIARLKPGAPKPWEERRQDSVRSARI